MSSEIAAILILGVYRILIVVAGIASAYMGYRLFVRGLFANAGELKAAWGERKLVLKQAAPGTFFALFGAAIVMYSIVNPFHIDLGWVRDPGQAASTENKAHSNKKDNSENMPSVSDDRKADAQVSAKRVKSIGFSLESANGRSQTVTASLLQDLWLYYSATKMNHPELNEKYFGEKYRVATPADVDHLLGLEYVRRDPTTLTVHERSTFTQLTGVK